MITSAAISLAGVVFAGRIAYKLTGDLAPAALGAVGGGRVCRPGPARHARRDGLQLLPLHPQLPVGSDDRHLLPGGDRLPSRRSTAGGVRDGLARRPRPARGVAVSGALHDLALARASAHPPAAGDRRRRDGAAVVRDPRAHVALVVRRRRQRQRLGPRALGQPDHGGHPPLRRPAPLARGARRAARGGLGGPAARPDVARARRRDRGVGGRRDRVRAARLAGARALHVRGGRRDGRAGRGMRGTTALRRPRAEPVAAAVGGAGSWRCW